MFIFSSACNKRMQYLGTLQKNVPCSVIRGEGQPQRSHTGFLTRIIARLVFYNVGFHKVRFPGIKFINIDAAYCKRRCGRSMPVALRY